jgi:hypothetical protein
MTRNRRDNNHSTIKKCAEEGGYPCCDTADLKFGFPDLLVKSELGILVLFEVKDGKEKLTPDEKEFFKKWQRCPLHVVRTCERFKFIMDWYDHNYSFWNGDYE